MLLVNLDYIITERTQIMAGIISSWTQRLDDQLDESNRKHFDQKILIEDKIAKQQKEEKLRQEQLQKLKDEEENN